VEFDDRLRFVDGILDVASLLMDLEALGRPDLSAALLSAYRRSALDDCPSSLVDHYIAHRACVRSKVAFLQGHRDAVRLLELARRHLEAARVRVVLIGGLPGSGKSTLAEALARQTGWDVLGTDRERRDLIGARVADQPSGDFGAGRYRPEISDRVYERLLGEAGRLLARGRSVILDGTWYRARWREQATATAAAAGADVHQLVCDVPSEVAADRITRRRAEPGLLSEATADTHLAMRELWEPWPQARTMDGTQPTERLVGAALEITGGLRRE
jgi:predicted kinase